MFAFGMLDYLTADEIIESGTVTQDEAKEAIEEFRKVADKLKAYISAYGTYNHDSDPTGYPV
jgi:hypothetical protein